MFDRAALLTRSIRRDRFDKMYYDDVVESAIIITLDVCASHLSKENQGVVCLVFSPTVSELLIAIETVAGVSPLVTPAVMS